MQRTMVSIAAATVVVALQLPAHVASGEDRRGRASITMSLVGAVYGGLEGGVEVSLPGPHSVVLSGSWRDMSSGRLSTVEAVGVAASHRWYVVDSNRAGRPGVFLLSRASYTDMSGKDDDVVGPPLSATGQAIDAITGVGGRIGRYFVIDGWIGAGPRWTSVEARCCKDDDVWRERGVDLHVRADFSMGIQF